MPDYECSAPKCGARAVGTKTDPPPGWRWAYFGAGAFVICPECNPPPMPGPCWVEPVDENDEGPGVFGAE